MHNTLIYYLDSVFLAHSYTRHGARCDFVAVSNVSKGADLAAPGHRDSSSGVDERQGERDPWRGLIVRRDQPALLIEQRMTRQQTADFALRT